MFFRILLSQLLFLGSLAVGWWLHRRGVITEGRASRLVRFIVMGPSPVVLCLLFWHMDLRSLQVFTLPLVGGFLSIATLLPAFGFARRAGLSRHEAGSFLTCALFSNIGYLGAFTAYALFGEVAYGLCQLYLLFFTPLFYTLGFGLAARYGHAKAAAGFGAAFRDELRLFPFFGMAAGALLSWMRVPRPQLLEGVNHVLIPLDTALYLAAVGSQLTFESPRPWLRSCLAMSGIKFLYTPGVAWALATLIGLQGLPRLIVLLEASTPVAVSPLVLPLLFGVDRRLANALWLFTTAAAIPWLLLIIPLLQRL